MAGNGKQAIVLIHGIGEQKPMETLRRFVDAVWSSDKSVQPTYLYGKPSTWSKPDRVSNSFELRRLTTAKNISGVRSDFFEFYWAHLMHGTTLTHVFAWAKTLLYRSPTTIPAQLLPLYFLLISGLVAAGFFLTYAIVAGIEPSSQFLPAWLSGSIGISIVPVLGWLLRNIVGDAARYLYPAPANIQRRHEIREAGLSLLAALHERGYERIIVVGHSLGSVIGYDILTHAWVEQTHPEHNQETSIKALELLETLAVKVSEEKSSIPIEDIQCAQRQYHTAYQELGSTWKVTDFITIGSPLTHAQILLAQDRKDLQKRQANRELPCCLPVLEEVTKKGQPTKRFSYKKGRGRVLHHAALFAPTCWTNIYFPNKHIIFGDLIAGPLASVFGKGINDVPVFTKQRRGLFTHTLYWSADDLDNEPPHITQLRDALDIANLRYLSLKEKRSRSD